jgi:hypothetical protein
MALSAAVDIGFVVEGAVINKERVATLIVCSR